MPVGDGTPRAGQHARQLDIPGDEPAIVSLRHEGTTYVRATTRTSEGRTIERLVHAHGPYGGIRPLNFRGQPRASLDIDAGGPWTITPATAGDDP